MKREHYGRESMRFGMILLLALMALTAIGQKQTAAPSRSASRSATVFPFFETKVRPLLLSSCVSCHGKESPQGGLRLDVALTPAKAQAVIERVKGEGGKQRMPLGAPLSKDKIADLEAWVKSGAKWGSTQTLSAPSLTERGKKHWAFQSLTRPAVPKVKHSAWVQNPIDAFVLKRLEAANLKPNPTASRRELIRRVFYDLTGLPPTPEEVSAFVQDKSLDAYPKLVDRLLASPHYGEKWGRNWLDLVRYAETNSYERDNPKPNISKYRDYVIRAFNEDKPYSRFIQEQLAGDEMPNAAGDAILATAYYRLGIWDDEPADVKQAQFDDLDDLVATTGQTFLGLTLDCARCHDHKLDPIPQKDYYRFLSFFHNINRFKNGGATDETHFFSTSEQKKAYERNVLELVAKRKANTAQLAGLEAEYRQKRSQLENPNDLSDLHYRYFHGAFATLPNFDKLKPVKTGTLSSFVDLRPRSQEENFAFVFEGTLNVPKAGDYTFLLDSDDGSRLIVNGKTLCEKNMGGGQGVEMHGKLSLPAGRVPFRLEYFQGGSVFGLTVAWSGPGFARRPLSTYESCGPHGLSGLITAEAPLVLGEGKEKEIVRLTSEKMELAKQEPVGEKALIVTEAGTKAPDTFVLLRGNPTTPGEKIEPGVPLCAGGGAVTVPTPLPDSKTTGRRTVLANWIASEQNPLTSRVIVNRIWQSHFGRGIVRTPSDFGLQGAPPTHPELLDWLAKEFMAQGWSFKKLHRLILLSNTYKQSSRAVPAALAKDPQNDLFWRFEMRRLTAEEIRDSLLAMSGTLNLTMYGDSVYPEIPKEILAGQSIPGADWYTEKMKPEDLNRRSIYIHVKRSLIYPMLANFDLPETDRSSPSRFSSTQPTQALSMMNSPLANRQAALLGERVRREVGGEGQAFTRRTLSLVMQRPPTKSELDEGIHLIAQLQKRGMKPDKAQVILCLMALNLDEFVYVD
ncbi:MAG: DUF1553 domain-containing protein [Chthonomonadaceae bacterium]|nr:DUF1553 domain-containing protein [Chthonomonadaceae bacterium]